MNQFRFTFQPVSARAGPNRIGPVPYLAGFVCAVVLVLEVSDVIISSSWGVLVANHQQTKSVSEALTVLGIDHFIPKIECICGHRRVRELRPLLGDYIPISVSSDWRSLSTIKGVYGWLLNDKCFPAQASPIEIERLRAMCDGDIFRKVGVPDKGFGYGQKVTPREGPFAYHVGRFDRKTKRGNDIALFSLLGKDQKVMFKSGELLAV